MVDMAAVLRHNPTMTSVPSEAGFPERLIEVLYVDVLL